MESLRNLRVSRGDLKKSIMVLTLSFARSVPLYGGIKLFILEEHILFEGITF